ncbi:MAG: 4-amino-4-deoxy-L-arabinose transferase [archaeon]
MKKKYKCLLLILTSVLLIDTGQLTLKYGLNSLGEVSWGLSSLLATLSIVILNPFIWIGVILMASSAFTWLIALSKSELSYAYPILSFGYVIVSILSWIFFNEVMTTTKIIGLIVIAAGVTMLSNT